VNDRESADLFRARFARSQRRVSRWFRREAGEIRPRRRTFRRDLVAGLPGAISSVPDGMASSILAGVNPAHGLYASFAGPIAGGLTSSTRLMVVTTTSAAALAAGSAVSAYDGQERSDAMVMLTLIAGGVMLLAALLRLSRYIRFVSYSVMLGFLTGVAVNMVLGQLPDLLGVDAHGGLSVTKGWYALTHPGQADGPTAAVGGVALALLVGLGLTRLAVVSPLLALLLPTVGAAVVGAGSVAVVADTGAIPQGLPALVLPGLDVLSPGLVMGAAAVAALVLVQGAGVAEAVPNADGRSSTRRDFVAQGVGNLASGLFGGQPVGGSVGQTALNVTAGAASRWAAIWSGLWMLAVLLVFADLVGEVATATLAAVLVYAGIGSIKPGEVLAVARAGLIPAVAMGTTFVSVLTLPIAQAVGIGLVASLLLQLNQEALDLRVVRLVPDGAGRLVEDRVPTTVGDGEVVVLDAYGSLFYAGARTLQRRLPAPVGVGPGRAGPGPVVLLRLRGRGTLGATFLKVVGDYAHAVGEAGGELYLTGVDPELAQSWERSDTARRLADVHVRPATPVLGESTLAAVAEAGRDRTTHRVTPLP
jgi:sulfate permease, SulP family